MIFRRYPGLSVVAWWLSRARLSAVAGLLCLLALLGACRKPLAWDGPPYLDADGYVWCTRRTTDDSTELVRCVIDESTMLREIDTLTFPFGAAALRPVGDGRGYIGYDHYSLMNRKGKNLVVYAILGDARPLVKELPVPESRYGMAVFPNEKLVVANRSEEIAAYWVREDRQDVRFEREEVTVERTRGNWSGDTFLFSNARRGWFALTSSYGYVQVWRVTPDGIEAATEIELEDAGDPPDEYGGSYADVSSDRRYVALSKSVLNHEGLKFARVRLTVWDLTTGRIAWRSLAASDGLAVPGFIAPHLLLVRDRQRYWVVDVEAGVMHEYPHGEGRWHCVHIQPFGNHRVVMLEGVRRPGRFFPSGLVIRVQELDFLTRYQ
jgi:hypothetical protein